MEGKNLQLTIRTFSPDLIHKSKDQDAQIITVLIVL
jgi:hypothetical protein